MKSAAQAYLKRKKLVLPQKIGKGWSAEVYRVQDAQGKAYAFKVEKQDSSRVNFLDKELRGLRQANRVGVGPRLRGFSRKAGAILMDYVEGRTLFDFVSSKPGRTRLSRVARAVLAQATALDAAGLSHGQLGGKAANILVTPSLDVFIVDFEKSSTERRPRNRFQTEALLFFNKHSFVARMVREILGPTLLEKLTIRQHNL